MKVSVFTPTHRPDHLMEAYRSLRLQTHEDWEWVLVPNGPDAKVPEAIERDERVRIAPLENHRIGALKAHAVENCTGGLLVELDHDDFLLPTCLSKLHSVAANSSGPVFIYSDTVNFWPDGTSETFSSVYGWETYDFRYPDNNYPGDWKDVSYKALRAFPATARSLAEISFCPNHVRAWSREAYQRAGGYNRDLLVSDDHDLLCRTYLSGTRFVHIPEVLYLYRRHANNTFEKPEMGLAIRKQSTEVMNAYLHPMIAEWCKREGLGMYDLGGGHRCPAAFTPVDMDLPEGILGIKLDVTTQPIGDFTGVGRVGCFRAVDFFEHIPSTKVPQLMNDLYAALAHGGWLITETPAVSDRDGRVGWGAFRDPTHVSFWCDDSWRYYTESELGRFVRAIKCRFQEVRIWNDYPSEAHHQTKCPYVFADLCAGKTGKRLPGGLRI